MKTAKDANWLSYSGDTVQFYLGTDHPETAIPPYPNELLPLFPADWDSLLKISHNEHPVEIYDAAIAQGKENAIDVNNTAAHVYIEGDIGVGSNLAGDQVVTIKGGSHHIVIKGLVHSTGKRCDLFLGAWSDQSYERSHTVDLSQLAHAKGRPLTVILSRVDKKTVKLPPGAKVLVFKGYLYDIWWWMNYFYAKTVYSWFIKSR